jgi:hypothetical protein
MEFFGNESDPASESVGSVEEKREFSKEEITEHLAKTYDVVPTICNIRKVIENMPVFTILPKGYSELRLDPELQVETLDSGKLLKKFLAVSRRPLQDPESEDGSGDC